MNFFEKKLFHTDKGSKKPEDQEVEERARQASGPESVESNGNRDQNSEAEKAYWDEYWDAYYKKHIEDEGVENFDLGPDDDDPSDRDIDRFDFGYDEYDPWGDDEDLDAKKIGQEDLRQTVAEMFDLLGAILGKQSVEANDDYAFFRHPEARDEVYEFSRAIAEYLHQEKIKDLVIVDRSSRPLYIGVLEYWKKIFPDEPHPKIYFINPKGFKDIDSHSSKKLAEINANDMFKDDPPEDIETARSQSQIMAEFAETYPGLMLDRDGPVMIFDTCIHSGNTLYSVVNIFEKLGFKDARVGSVNPSDSHSKVQSDFFITTESPEQGCYPFDRDRKIEKTFEHVYSKPSNDSLKRLMSMELRKEIKRIMQEHLK